MYLDYADNIYIGNVYYFIVGGLVTMKTVLILLAFVLGVICSGCAGSGRGAMPNKIITNKLEYKAGGQSRVYHNDSNKDYTGIDLSVAFVQQW